MSKFKLSFSLAFMLGISNINANEVDYSYSFGENNYGLCGTEKAETYDIAIRLTDPALIGSKIKAFSVPLVQSNDITNISVWASNELTLENKVNKPDIISLEASCADGIVNVIFPEMIQIPKGGIYVGYSFTVDKKTEETLNPVSIVGEPYEDGLYMHTSRTYLKWKSHAFDNSINKSSAISVTLDGDFYVNSLGIKNIEEPLCVPGEEVLIEATFLNHGSEPVSSIEYTVTCGDNTHTGDIAYNPAQTLSFGESLIAGIPYTAPEISDEYNITVEITKVNGEVNHDISAKGETILLVLDEVPVNRPLVEEYTGMWCQNCPRGLAALEYMNKKYPKEFVAISYHNNDALERIKTSSFPNTPGGYPDLYINRIYNMDPYYSVTNDFSLPQAWLPVQEQFTPVIVNGTANEKEGAISVDSEISFVKTVQGKYKVAYAIIADGLSNPEWQQINNMSGSNPADFIPEMEKFCRGSHSMPGVIYDDVFAAGSNLKGEQGSLIENVVKDQKYTHSFTFAKDDGISSSGYDMFSNARELHAVIIVIDENGSVVNSNKIQVNNHVSGIDSIDGDTSIMNTEYFNLNGLKVTDPHNGIFIKVDINANGKQSISKVFFNE